MTRAITSRAPQWIILAVAIQMIPGRMTAQEPQVAPDSTIDVGVTWAADVRPVLLSTVLVSPVDLHGTKTVGFWFEQPKPGLETSLDTAVVKAISDVFINKSDLILPLAKRHAYGYVPEAKGGIYAESVGWKDGKMVSKLERMYLEVKKSPPSMTSAVEGYGNDILSDPLVLAMVMPDIHSTLASFDKVCSDCPGPTDPWMPEQVSWSELMSMVVSSFTPVEIGKKSVTFSNETIFLDAGGKDLRLFAAAHLTLDPNRSAHEAVQKLVSSGFKEKTYKQNKKTWTEAEKIEFFRNYLAERLPDDSGFVTAVKEKARQVFPRLALECPELTEPG